VCLIKKLFFIIQYLRRYSLFVVFAQILVSLFNKNFQEILPCELKSPAIHPFFQTSHPSKQKSKTNVKVQLLSILTFPTSKQNKLLQKNIV
jgi:hypothetical protein